MSDLGFITRHLGFIVRRLRPKGAKVESPGHRPGNRANEKIAALKGRYPRRCALSGLADAHPCFPRALPWAFELPRLRRSTPTQPARFRTRSAIFARVALCALVTIPSLCAEVQIERGYLPDAGPSSFAISLPGGINFCFDPVRGGVSYVWTGEFLDLSPMRPGAGKFIKPAKLLGPVVYRESGPAPLRRGDPGRTPTFEFAGYSLRDDAVEFRYTIDGALVREEIRARPGGGLVRRFNFEGGSDAKWWHVVDGKPATELKRETGGGFVLEIPFGAEVK